ncbi:MAG: hypothetical protein QHG98_07485 [Methanothrix sp.]|jgi:hypothetical protein|nr:hypothetical protein [Methanothrix sp.]
MPETESLINYGQIPPGPNVFDGLPNTSQTVKLIARSIHDVVIVIAGVYFPLRSLTYTKAITVDEEDGSGSHLPWTLTVKNMRFSGTFEFGSFLMNGASAMSPEDINYLTTLLENQADEGQPNYFHIIIHPRKYGGLSVPIGGGEWTSPTPNLGQLPFIEALMYCRVTEHARRYQENNTIVNSYNFKFLRRRPK